VLSIACSSNRPAGPSQSNNSNASAAAPSITAQPSSEAVNPGQGASLWVTVSGPGPVTHQWFFGESGDTSTPISGATDWIYNTPNLFLTSPYWVRVANSAGGVNSSTALITVRTPSVPAGDPFESQVLTLINQSRAAGATCGSTSFPPAAALSMDANLQNAARLHSQDMAVNGYFSHTSLDGRTFTQRIQNAGFMGSPLGENIAGGYPSPQAVVDGWMASTGHCSNIMSGSFQFAGIGYISQSSSPFGQYWTADFGG
jgi:uncharacterized protein YkwD